MKHTDGISDVAILRMGTALPVHSVAQSDIADLIASTLQDQPDLARFARRVFRSCGVETRYTCESNYLGSLEECRYLPSHDESDIPTTEERMDTYKREALPLGISDREGNEDAGMSPDRIRTSHYGQLHGPLPAGHGCAVDSSFGAFTARQSSAVDISGMSLRALKRFRWQGMLSEERRRRRF